MQAQQWQQCMAAVCGSSGSSAVQHSQMRVHRKDQMYTWHQCHASLKAFNA
jgi:predicted SprT family Zn-dependent metalloprotease